MNRIAIFDTIRGFLLVMMAVDHLPGKHRQFTYEAFGLVSAAEGFVFLAGLVSAYYALGLMAKGGLSLVREKMHGRARLIYICHLLLLGGLVLYGYGVQFFTLHIYGPEVLTDPNSYCSYWASAFHPFYTQPFYASLMAALLVYQPPLLDILPIYCFFQFVAPYVLQMIERGHLRTVLCASFGLWLLAQPSLGFWTVAQPDASVSQIIIGSLIPADWQITFWVFDPFAWQFLFVLGFVGGVLAKRGELYKSVSVFAPMAVAFVAVGLFLRYGVVLGKGVYDPWAHRSWLGAFRLVNAISLFYLISLVMLRWGQHFNFSWLGCLGRYSLPVFCYHLLFIYVGDFYFQRMIETPSGDVLMIITIIILVASLNIPIHLAEKWKELRSAPGSRPAIAA